MEQLNRKANCEDCARTYGDASGFPDLVIPYRAWRQISTNGNDSGLLCPSCIIKRLMDKGIQCEGAFMSGPVRSVSPEMMHMIRSVENIELAIEGRDNRWAAVREIIESEEHEK